MHLTEHIQWQFMISRETQVNYESLPQSTVEVCLVSIDSHSV